VWAKVDDRMPQHPKFARAAGRLGGPEALARVIAFEIEALCHSCAYGTNGHLDSGTVSRFRCTSEPLAVAEAMVSAGLLHVVEDGFEIHDFLRYQLSADDAEKRRRQRISAGRKGGRTKANNAVAKAVATTVANDLADAKCIASPDATDTEVAEALAKAYPVPVPVPVPDPEIPPTAVLSSTTEGEFTARTGKSTDAIASAPSPPGVGLTRPPHKLLCVMASKLLAQQPELGSDVGNFKEALKVAAARARLEYSGETVRKAVDATLRVRGVRREVTSC
jgi:hypothetical protein